MPNRFTDTDIWKKQKWFKKLPALYKLSWKYITDCCDHAGIWKIDISELVDDLGEDDFQNFNLQDFIAACNKDFDKKTGKSIFRQRIVQFNEDHLWLTGFILFQYGKNGEVTENFGAARSAIRQLKELCLYDQAIENKYFIHIIPEKKKNISEPSQTLPDPPRPSGSVPEGNSKGIGKGKGIKEEDRGVGEEEEEEVLIDEKLIAPRMVSLFKTSFPNYPIDLNLDFTSCLEIAYKIAKLKGWKKDSVLNGKMETCLLEWSELIGFVKSDKWYSQKSISFLNDKFQDLIQAKNFKDGAINKSTVGKTFEPDKF